MARYFSLFFTLTVSYLGITTPLTAQESSGVRLGDLGKPSQVRSSLISQNNTIPGDSLGAPSSASLLNDVDFSFEDSKNESSVQVGTQDASQPEIPGYRVNFSNLNIKQVIHFISEITGKNFIYNEEELNFPVTIVSEKPIDMDSLLSAFAQVLRINGFVILEQGNNLIIHSNREVSRIPRIEGGRILGDSSGEETEIVTRIFRMENIAPDRVSKLIKTLLSSEASVEEVLETRHLVVTDLRTNIERVSQLVRELDDPQFGKEVGQYVVQNRTLQPLVELLKQILEPMLEDTPTEIFANPESRSIFIISTPFVVERAIGILQTLDMTSRQTRIMNLENTRYLEQDDQGRFLIPEDGRALESWQQQLLDEQRLGIRGDSRLSGKPVDPKELSDLSGFQVLPATRFQIYKLHNRTATNLASALTAISGSLQQSEHANQDLVDAIASVEPIDETNSIVFTGTDAAVERVRELVKELDVPLRQVLIEVLVLEASISDSLNFGVEWAARLTDTPSGAGTISVLNAGSTLPAALTTVENLLPDASTLGAGTGFTVGGIGRTLSWGNGSFTSLGALIRAVQEKSNVKIVMNPKILTEDNNPAELFVGINTRFQTDSISNDQGTILTTNFEYRDVGTTLRVTPKLGEGDLVSLEIEQEISQAIDNEDTQTQQQVNIGPTTRISRTVTRVHVPNKHFLILSGMIQEQKDRGRTQVPCLGGLPVAGSAFGSRRDATERNNLIMFLRPIILDTEQEMRQVTRDQHDLFDNKSYIRPHKFMYDIDTGLECLQLREPKPF